MNKIRILVVDDDPPSCQLLARILEKEGYQVDQAVGGRPALDLLKENEYQIAFLDIRMPQVSGLDLLAAMKKAGTRTEVIMHTAYASLETSIEAMNQGALGYIIKPFRPQEVRLTARRALEKIELEEENLRLMEDLKKKNLDLQTALRQLEDLTYRLVTSEKMAALITFGGGIAHELNNPLTSIMGLLSILLEKEEPETERYDRLRKMREEVLRCADIVKDLLTFSREVSGKPENVNVNDVLSKTLNLMEAHFERAGVRPEVKLDKKIPMIRATPGQLGHVFLNLLLNALEAVKGKKEPLIGIEVRRLADTVVINVKDNGRGISRDNITRIFEPFFTTAAPGQGAGMGLAVCDGVIGSLGGKISVESKIGQGSTFQVILPALTEG